MGLMEHDGTHEGFCVVGLYSGFSPRRCLGLQVLRGFWVPLFPGF